MAATKLRYYDNVRHCPDWPVTGMGCACGIAFRWVHSPVTANDFIPIGVNQPRRAKDSTDWALSFYRTDEQARVAYGKLKPLVKKIDKLLGDHVAKGSLTQTMGLTTPTDSQGHFDLHELPNAVFHVSFAIDGQPVFP